MINYIWIGLIVLAIGYGAWREFTEPPPMEEPRPVVLSFEDGAVGDRIGDLVVGDAVLYKKHRRSAQAAYNLAAQDEMRVALEIEIPETYEYLQRHAEEPKKLKPAKLVLLVRGDGTRNELRAEFHDALGYRFLAPDSFVLEDGKKWKLLSVDLASIVPAAVNPDTKATYPLRLTSLVVAAKDEQTRAGTFHIDTAYFELPKILIVSQDLESKSWMGVLTQSAAEWARVSINLAIGLIGIMMLWLGMMRIAEKAGLVEIIARLVKPVMRRLFPDIPPEGDAMGAIVMNVAANMLGLGNAATPLGIKAMQELQKLNPSNDYATNAQCMLLAINTSSVTVIPVTVIAFRAATGSTDLMAFWAPMIGATLFSTFCAVLTCKMLEKMPAFRIPPEELLPKTAQPGKEA